MLKILILLPVVLVGFLFGQPVYIYWVMDVDRTIKQDNGFQALE